MCDGCLFTMKDCFHPFAILANLCHQIIGYWFCFLSLFCIFLTQPSQNHSRVDGLRSKAQSRAPHSWLVLCVTQFSWLSTCVAAQQALWTFLFCVWVRQQSVGLCAWDMCQQHEGLGQGTPWHHYLPTTDTHHLDNKDKVFQSWDLCLSSTWTKCEY